LREIAGFSLDFFKLLVLLRLGMKEQFDSSVDTIQTTIGELIEAITSVALEAGRSQEEGYELASQTLSGILERHNLDLDLS